MQNFRSCIDVTVAFDNYTCLVGQNGAGKSTVLAALNVLFRNATSSTTPVAALSEEDFCHRDTARPIVLTATFGDLSEPEQGDFKAYYRGGQLVVTARATWDPASERAEVLQFGARHVMRAFAPWFEALASGASGVDLKERFKALRDAHPEITAATTKPAMESALRAYEELHPELSELIESEDQFYGWSRGENRLRKYFQWVYVPAIKEASGEQAEGKATALGELLQRRIRAAVDFESPLAELREKAQLQYDAILASKQDALKEVSSALEAQLREWAHPEAKLDLEWHGEVGKAVAIQGPIAKASIGEGAFVGEVARLGHGLQRAFILTLLQALAAHDVEGAPTLLLGFEEPELFQHPPQAQHLAGVLQTLSKGNAQVIVATHSPYFVDARTIEHVRYFRKDRATGHSRCAHVTLRRLAEVLAEALGDEPEQPSAIMAQMEQILQPTQRELLFCSLPILVEGLEDIAFIGTHLRLSDRWDDFRRIGGHFVIAGGKTNLSRPVAIARELGMPFVLVFDGDGPYKDAAEQTRQRRDNQCLLRLAGLNAEDPLSEVTVASGNVRMWPTNIGDVVREELTVERWSAAEAAARNTYGFHGARRKNGLLLTATLELLWLDGLRSQILEALCADIITHGTPA